MISRVHSFLVYTHHQWKVRDNRSVNGVFVNDRKVHEAVLKDGDVVIFGGGGNRPIGAVLEQRDWDFKYEFRINHKWNMPSQGDDASEDDTADGETEPRDESTLFEMDGIDHQTQEVMEEEVEGMENGSENPKKRKRSWMSLHAFGSREDMMKMEKESQDAELLASTVEWEAGEPATKKFCPTDSPPDAVPLLPYLNDMNGAVKEPERNENGMEGEGMEKNENENDLGPVAPCDDIRSRLIGPIGDLEAEKRISALQLELYAACEERRALVPKYAYPDDSEVQCKACKNLIFSPTKLGCGHSLCDGCVECLVIESPNCPVCAKAVVQPIQLDTEMHNRVLTIVREWPQTERAEWFAHMIKRNDRVRKAGLELLLESFRAHGVKFVNIEERWSDMDRTLFAERVDMYMAAPRISFCDAVGLTSSWIQQADFDQLLTALGNVGISITPLINRSLKLIKEKEKENSSQKDHQNGEEKEFHEVHENHEKNYENLGNLVDSASPPSSSSPSVNASDPMFIDAFRNALLHFTMHNRRHLQFMQHQQLQQIQLLQQRVGPPALPPLAPVPAQPRPHHHH